MNAFDTWLSIYIERAADDKMCIYCLGVNKYFSFLFFLYIFFTIHFTNMVINRKLGTFIPTQ